MPPFQNSPTAKLIADPVRDLSHRKTQAEIASEAGFPNANMMTFLKNGRNKVPIDRVPSLAKALEVDPAYRMRLAPDQPTANLCHGKARSGVDRSAVHRPSTRTGERPARRQGWQVSSVRGS